MRTSAPINIIVHYPTTEEGRRELANRVAEVHADAVLHTIKKLNCPTKQKQALLDAVIATKKREMRQKENDDLVR